jgi:hypothetical protein
MEALIGEVGQRARAVSHTNVRRRLLGKLHESRVDGVKTLEEFLMLGR